MHLASGHTLLCRAAIYTAAICRPVLPGWLRPLLAPEVATNNGDHQQQQQDGAIHASHLQLPAGICTADTVHLGNAAASLDGKQLVVIGGGMSAGLLAAGAAERGAHVHLVCRRCGCSAGIGWEVPCMRKVAGVLLLALQLHAHMPMSF